MPLTTRRKSCPVFVQSGDAKVATKLFALTSESPAEITLKAGEIGFRPYGARFDRTQYAWIVRSIDWHPPAQRAGR
jgi:hypothetical protein